MYGLHWINTTGGDLDVTWTTADYQAVEAANEAMWTSLASMIPSGTRLVEHRWYPYGPDVNPPNPPVRVTTLGTPKVGTGAAGGAHQVAETVTLRTPLRRHWGRIYLPLGVHNIATGGQFSSSTVDTIAAAARTMLTASFSSQGICPVVYDRNRRSALGVTAVECDSVPDIIRRRRPRTTAYRKIYTS